MYVRVYIPSASITLFFGIRKKTSFFFKPRFLLFAKLRHGAVPYKKVIGCHDVA